LRFEQLELRLNTESGVVRTLSRRRASPGLSGGIGRDFQFLELPHAVFEQVAGRPVTIHGRLAAVLTEPETAVIPSRFGPGAVAGFGRCASGPADAALWRVMCESPETIPPTRVKLRHGAESIGRPQALGDSAPVVRYPLTTWLSPLNRRQTFFHLREDVPPRPGTEWLVPAGAIQGAIVELERSIETRRIVADYSLGPLRLADYLPPGNRGSMNLR
jgi:hypothetical protein